MRDILSGQSSGYRNSLLVKVQTNVIASTDFWQGTNVTVNGGNAVFWLQGAQNLSRLARVPGDRVLVGQAAGQG